jgi:hypothetical protein
VGAGHEHKCPLLLIWKTDIHIPSSALGQDNMSTYAPIVLPLMLSEANDCRAIMGASLRCPTSSQSSDH